MLHAIILAGGTGSRLWPASRIAKPKHLLTFGEPQTLLQATVARLIGLVPTDRTWIVTNRTQADHISDSMSFGATHILAEPLARNTAPCIGWAALKVCQVDPDAVMVVLPADHIIKPDSIFQKTIQRAADIVKKTPETLVTIGIKPTFPSTSYGYIRRGDVLVIPNCSAYHVSQFCEKPKLEIAEQLYQSGEHYWNAGIFVWKAKTILELLRRFEPEVMYWLDRLVPSFGTRTEMLETAEAFIGLKSISIDYAVMEKAKNVVVLEAAFDWNDVGTWSALDRLYADQKDGNGNLAVSSHLIAIDSTGCTVQCADADHLIALIGMHNVVIIQTDDATLIARKDQEESVRRIAEELKNRKNSHWR